MEMVLIDSAPNWITATNQWVATMQPHEWFVYIGDNKKNKNHIRYFEITDWITANAISAKLFFTVEQTTPVCTPQTFVYYVFESETDAVQCVLMFGQTL